MIFKIASYFGVSTIIAGWAFHLLMAGVAITTVVGSIATLGLATAAGIAILRGLLTRLAAGAISEAFVISF